MRKKTEKTSNKPIIIRPQQGKQEMFLRSPADICIYGGAAGGGKTYASSTELFTSMININHISAQKMIQAEDGVQKQVYQKLKQANPTFSPTQDDAVAVAKEFLIDGLEKGSIA